MRKLPEKHKQAVDLYLSGTPVSEISKLLNSSYSSIYTWIKNQNITFRRNDGVNITKRFLIEEYVEKKRPIEDIAKEANTTVSAISKALIRHELTDETLWDGNEPLNWLHPLQEQLIYGSLFGDAFLEMHHGTARLKFEHGLSQRTYCEHKFQVLRNLTHASELAVNDRYHKKADKTYTAVSFRTMSSKLFSDIHPLFYRDRVKYVSEHALRKLDDRGLTYWFQDDGFKNQNLIGLATDAYSDQDRETIIRWFRERWCIKAYTRDSRVFFQGVDAYKFEKLVEPNLLNEFRYKIGSTFHQ